MKKINGRITHKHDIEENWNKSVNFIPMSGEIIVYDVDETHSKIRIKVGNGVDTVVNLPFSVADDIHVGANAPIDDSVNIWVDTDEASVGGGSGGISSWNDLTDKPFGDMVEVFPETEFVLETGLGVFVYPGGYSDGLVTGYDYVIRYNGVDYPCTAIDAIFSGMTCVGVGNPAAMGGEDNGMPFAAAYAMGGLGVVPLDGSTSVVVGMKAPRKLHPQYVPTQAPYVYECSKAQFSSVSDGFGYDEPELPLALLEAVYYRRPIYMRVRDTNDEGIYNDVELFGPASAVGNYQYMALGLGLADKTSEIFKIPEGTMINGTEVNTKTLLYAMGLRISSRFAYYINSISDFFVIFVDYTGLD